MDVCNTRSTAEGYSRFNTLGTQWKVRLNTPPPTTPPPDPVSHYVGSVNNMFEYVLEDEGDADMFGITIHNEVNQSDTPIDFNYIRRICYPQMSYVVCSTK
jgi:hypothetical protein